MRTLILIGALVLFGCDDPAVQEKALSVLENGISEARAECDWGATINFGSLTPQAFSFRARATKFHDGSCFTSLYVAGPTWVETRVGTAANFSPRGTPCGAQAFVNGVGFGGTYPFSLEVADGVAEVEDPGGSGCTGCALSLSSCTGFNLEAFGG